MRVLVQRCKQACCKVDNKTTGQIDDGFDWFVGFTEGDNKEINNYFAHGDSPCV